jgi:hypothetical protein
MSFFKFFFYFSFHSHTHNSIFWVFSFLYPCIGIVGFVRYFVLFHGQRGRPKVVDWVVLRHGRVVLVLFRVVVQE